MVSFQFVLLAGVLLPDVCVGFSFDCCVWGWFSVLWVFVVCFGLLDGL